ncbi:MAG: septum formation initiator family protein [Pseudomonadota bacterium]
MGQSVEQLQRQLAEKDAENQQLRQRIEVLEREITPSRIEQARRAPDARDPNEDESNRALERALVREGGLLLASGTRELEPNAAYSYRDNKLAQTRRHSFGPALAVRFGLPWRLQIEASIPYVFERRRDGAASSNSDGSGDLAVSLSHQLFNERPFVPALIGALQYQAATGKNTVFDNASPVAHGSGFNAIQASVTALKRIDPLVIFGNYSFTHTLAETRNGSKIDPGNSQTVRFGSALATGPDTSLRAALSVTLFDKTTLDGRILSGTSDALGMLELGGSAVLNASTAIDVMVGIGLTSNAPDFRILVAVPIRF